MADDHVMIELTLGGIQERRAVSSEEHPGASGFAAFFHKVENSLCLRRVQPVLEFLENYQNASVDFIIRDTVDLRTDVQPTFR